MSLITELKRRNVFRVALVYIVASWLILQVADVGISLLGLPVTTGRLVFLLLAIGFPLVMLFSWAYEITPEGVKRESEVSRDASITADTAKKLNTAVIALLLLSLGALLLDRLNPRAPAEIATTTTTTAVATAAAPSERSIAVLPFLNMSADEENGYFSDGLSEELLNLLAKIPELKVAARTSAFSFKNSDADIAEIAAKLNVAHVLEGSVRKSGDRIRITAQLIKASDGFHLWSNTWDRTLHDVFAIQDEIAAAVVNALKVSLLGEIPHARVTDPEAFSLFLKSRAAANRWTKESLEEAAALLTQALAIDPDYAEAWAELAALQANQVGQGYVPIGEGYSRAQASAERALVIDPEHARGMSVLAWVTMYHHWDFPRAAELALRARQIEPGNPSVLNTLAVINGSLGRPQEMESLYRESLSTDPLSIAVLSNLAAELYGSGRNDEMGELIARIRSVEPDSLAVRMLDAFRLMDAGSADAALDALAPVEALRGQWVRAMAFYDLGRDQESDAAIQALIDAGGQEFYVGSIYGYRGENDKAFEWFELAYSTRSSDLIEIRLFNFLQPLASDPRWEPLLQKIGVSDAIATSIPL